MADEGTDVKALRDKPVLYPELEYVWNAFATLSGCRQFSIVGAGAIPVSEVLAYCDLMKIGDVEERSDILYLIQAMDNVFLSEINKTKSKTKAK
ncbi:phage tail assembly chaperone [Pyramidobacter piscolens]|uniref:phage tail assembly chaperone n=1 Tax=Pyramidobacter piscolens TaxID=638849 RepID=UPI001FCB2538|nr:hypothetical protein [Pyramidobacter piscolens]